MLARKALVKKIKPSIWICCMKKSLIEDKGKDECRGLTLVIAHLTGEFVVVAQYCRHMIPLSRA